MRELINFCLMRRKQLIAVTKLGAKQTDNKNSYKLTFDKASLKLAIIFPLITVF